MSLSLSDGSMASRRQGGDDRQQLAFLCISFNQVNFASSRILLVQTGGNGLITAAAHYVVSQVSENDLLRHLEAALDLDGSPGTGCYRPITAGRYERLSTTVDLASDEE